MTHVLTAGSPPLRLILVKEGFVWSSVSGLFISCQFQYLHVCFNHETPAYLNQKIPWTPLNVPKKKGGGVSHIFNQPTKKSEKKKQRNNGRWAKKGHECSWQWLMQIRCLDPSSSVSRPFRWVLPRLGSLAPKDSNGWGFTHNIWARWLTKVQGCRVKWWVFQALLFWDQLSCHVPGDSAGDLFVDGDLWPFQRLFVTFN